MMYKKVKMFLFLFLLINNKPLACTAKQQIDAIKVRIKSIKTTINDLKKELTKTAQEILFGALPVEYLNEKELEQQRTLTRHLTSFIQKLSKQNQTTFTSQNLESFLFAQSIEEFEQSLNSVPTETNFVRKKLAQKWIRNAAVRVFSDDLRSFLEIAVNACDAMLPPEKVVGKFGMGFFSILSLLALKETNGTVITISTSYKPKAKSKDQAKQKYPVRAFIMKFSKAGKDLTSWNDADIKVDFEWLLGKDKTAIDTLLTAIGGSPNIHERTGTIVSIVPKTGTFSDTTLKTLHHYVHYLEKHPNAKIKLVYENNTSIKIEELLGSGDKDAPQAEILLSPKELSVKDTGIGISPEIALLHLLVPSTSTKGKSDLGEMRKKADTDKPQLPELIEWKGKEDVNQSHFLIAVNGVIVIDKKLKEPFKTDDGKVKDLVFNMPQATQLTIARDELEISPDGKSFEERQLKRTISETLSQLIKTHDEKQLPAIMALYKGLEAWEGQTASSYIKGLFTRYFKQQLESILNDPSNANVLFCMGKYAENFRKISNHIGGSKYIILPLDENLVSYNFSRLEEAFLSLSEPKGLLNKNLFPGVNVIFIPENLLPSYINDQGKIIYKISTLGLRTTIFASDGLKSKTNDEIKNEIIARFSDIILDGTQKKSSVQTSIRFLISTITDDVVWQDKDGKNFTDHYATDFFYKYFWNNGDPVFKFFVNQKNPTFLNETIKFFKDIIDASFFKTDLIFFKSYVRNPFKDEEYLFLPEIDLSTNWNDQLFKKIQEQCKQINTFLVCNDLFKYKIYDNPIFADFPDGNKPFFFLNSPSKNKNWASIFSSDEKHSIKLMQPNKTLNSSFFDSAGSPDLFTSVSIPQFMDFLLFCIVSKFGISQITSPNGAMYLWNPSEEEFKQLLPLPVDGKFYDFLANLFEAVCCNSRLLPNENEFLEVASQLDKKIKKVSPDVNVALYNITKNTVLEPIVNKAYPQNKLKTIITLQKKIFKNELVFLGFKDKTEDDISEFINKFEDKIANINLYDNNLRPQIPNIAVASNIIPLLLLDLSLNFNNDNPKISTFVNAILGLYDHYFSINPNEYQTSYGESLGNMAIIPAADINESAIVDLIKNISVTKALFEKLLIFTIDDFTNQTEIAKRVDDLSRYIFYVPAINSNTPLSLLAVLMEQGANKKTIDSLIEYANSAEELIFTSYLLLQDQSLNLLNSLQISKPDQIGAVIENLLEQIVREKIDKEKIKEVLSKNRIKENLKSRIETFKDESFNTLVESYLNTQVNELSVFKNKIQNVTTDKASVGSQEQFLLKRLIRAHSLGKGLKSILENNNLDEALKKISETKTPVEVNKITQDVEAGSERHPVEASIIECLQNSIDAIKSFFKHVGEPSQKKSLSHRLGNGKQTVQTVVNKIASIDFDLGFVPDSSGQTGLYLTISDYVGMPSLKTLLTDLILPDYSEKSPEEGNIGDMGNGTFKLYQAAQAVVFTTRVINDPTKVFMLYVTPIRDSKSNLVVDLDLNCVDVSGQERFKEFYGTTITVIFKNLDTIKTTMDLLAAQDFLYNCVGSTNVFFGDLDISGVKIKPTLAINLMGKLLNPAPKTEDYIYEYKNAKGAILFSAQKKDNKLLQSYITTAGVPFRSLTGVMREMNLIPLNFIAELNSGLVINLAPGTYQPVQSRTHLKMENAMQQDLRKFLLEVFYLLGLNKSKTDEDLRNIYFTHYKSRISNFFQLKLSEQAGKNFEAEYKNFTGVNPKPLSMSPETFFVYYKSLQIPPVQTVKSFYDVITAESNNPNSLVSQINTKKTQLESECLQEFTKYKLALDPKTKLKPKTSDEIEKEWSNFYSAKQNELSEFIKTTFSAWKGKLSTKYKFGSRTLFNDILPSWFEGKIIGITLKNFNLSLFLNPPNPSKLPGINLLFKPTKQIESDKEFEEEFKKQNVNLLEVKNIIDLFLDSYVDAYYQSLGKIKTITALFQNESDGSMLAYFNGSKVVVNLQAFPGIYQIFDFIQNLLAKNFSALKNDSIFQRWFGPNMVLGRAPTVNHELEHARRNDASDKSIHDPAKDALGQDAKFEQCAASFAKKAYDSGLLEKWYALIKMKTLINAKTPKDLEVLSGKVKALEIKNKSELCKRLG